MACELLVSGWSDLWCVGSTGHSPYSSVVFSTWLPQNQGRKRWKSDDITPNPSRYFKSRILPIGSMGQTVYLPHIFRWCLCYVGIIYRSSHRFYGIGTTLVLTVPAMSRVQCLVENGWPTATLLPYQKSSQPMSPWGWSAVAIIVNAFKHGWYDDPT